MSGEAAISVEAAQARILEHVVADRTVETTPLRDALGRTLARDVASRRTQPPGPVSAMDGFAVRAADLASLPVRLKRIGESAAGHGFAGCVGPGEAVRIFTGAPAPQGADAILMQEDARFEADWLEPLRAVSPGQHLRPAGLDFAEGDVLLRNGTRLGPAAIALAAAMNHAELPVVRKPKVGIVATGNELVSPGSAVGPNQIVASNAFGLAALIEAAGGAPFDLGIAPDRIEAIEAAIAAAIEADCDVLVTTGGASVGDHDLVKPALEKAGMALSFWQIAMRPGKPLLHGRLGRTAILGLPGNPVSAIVGGVLFLWPLVRAMCGDPRAAVDRTEAAVLGAAVRGADWRQDYLRATLHPAGDGLPIATPFQTQDSSMLRLLAEAQCLVIRPPRAPAAQAGEPCRILRLPTG